MSTTGVARLDRPVLVGNLVSGALWLLQFVSLGGWVLCLLGAAYVAVGSVFLAAVYGRTRSPCDKRRLRGSRHGWWLWRTWVGVDIGRGTSSGSLTLWFGLVIATGATWHRSCWPWPCDS